MSTVAALLLACLVLLPLLGHRPLTDWDEGIYAEIAREMLGGGWRGWLVPHWNGQLWFEKPPLLFWLTAVSLKLFGLNAFAARLPSALAGIASVGVLHAWMLRRCGSLAAWLGTVLLLAAFGFQHIARAGETDALLGLGCLVAVIGLAEVEFAGTGGWWLFWTGFAAALMTKGAGSLALPITAAILSAWPGSRPRRFGAAFWLGLGAFALLVLPWHVLLLARFGVPFLREYLGFHVIGRATGQIEGHITHWWFYLWVLLVSAPPFALLYPAAVAAPFRGRSPRPMRAFAVFALVELGLFTAVRTRLPHYIAPAYPALSALTGALLAKWIESRQPLSRRRWAGLALGAIALYGAGAVLTAKPRKALHSAHMANGLVNPDNRESAALLHEIVGTVRIGGPLLVWKQGLVVPVQTDAFYARRVVQQIRVAPAPGGATIDKYFFSPEPLSAAMRSGEPRLILLDRDLVSQMPARYELSPLAAGATEEVAVIAPRH